MRASGVFAVGAILGAAVVWLWGRELEAYVQERTRGVRTKAAEGVRAVEAKAEQVLDRGGDALRRVDEFLQDTQETLAEMVGTTRPRISAFMNKFGNWGSSTTTGVSAFILPSSTSSFTTRPAAA